MEGYKNIEEKLYRFVRKFYTNELIKGGILFFSFGILYLFLTLFIEYFLWLKPTARTGLFWLFIAVESYFFFRFIMVPISKLIGFKKGISYTDSSKIIGDHFPEVRDKLLNVMQLKSTKNHSELLIASIEQKAKELQPIPFVKAVNFRTNKKYVKYALIPLFVWVLLSITGNLGALNTSFNRVLQHRTAFVPPAPFSFELLSIDLSVIQGEEYTVKFAIKGTIRPTNVLIFYNNESYYVQQKENVFKYTFSNTSAPIQFYVASNDVVSELYELDIIKTPTIQNISVDLNYPSYLQKKDETVTNFGTLLLPEGTKASWKARTVQTDTLVFIEEAVTRNFTKMNATLFSFQAVVKSSFEYQIASSNAVLKNYEKLFFTIEVIKDAYPMIEVVAASDSLTRNRVLYAGQISDDYGLSRLEAVYYNMDAPEEITKKEIEISRSDSQSFYFDFPGVLPLTKGVNYAMYFQVFDNDGVNGSKKSKSQLFKYRIKSDTEVEEEQLQMQRDQIKSIEKTQQKRQLQKEKLEDIQERLQNNKNMNWNDKKNISTYIKRQEGYKKMMQLQTDKLQSNLKKSPKDTSTETEQKELLKKRIEELKKIEKEQKLLDELKKVASKLNRDDLLRKVKKLAEQNKQQERSLERVLELTKRFYVEQKTRQVAEKLKDLAIQQDSLSRLKTSSKVAQDQIKEAFDTIKKELDALEKDNKDLKNPMQLPTTKEQQKEVEKELENVEKNEAPMQRGAQKESQKKASDKMDAMAQMMQNAMAAESADMKEENVATLRLILENLLNYSFSQEELMNRFSVITVAHPNFGKEIKSQNMLKSYFEHIDDSLYVLAMRLPQISVKIQKDLEDTHFNIDQSLENFSENRFSNGLANQQYVLTGVNNLADRLSTILDNMQNPKMSLPGKGKKGGNSFSLPDLIKKQGDLLEQMKEGTKKGAKKNGNKKGKSKGDASPKDADGTLYRIYQEQAQLRESLENAIKEGLLKGANGLQKVLQSMEALENQILEKGYTSNTLQRMQQLNYSLLKLEKAALKQEQGSKRKSNTSFDRYKPFPGSSLKEKLFYNQIEILNRQSLPLQNNYKKKVQKYFGKLNKGVEND